MREVSYLERLRAHPEAMLGTVETKAGAWDLALHLAIQDGDCLRKKIKTLKKMLREIHSCTIGAPLHPLPKQFVFAELPRKFSIEVKEAGLEGK